MAPITAMDMSNSTTMSATPLAMNVSTGSKGMFGMDIASTFSTNTNLTLFFIGWKTTTPGAYFGTLVFLFILTVFTRFLTAWRRQLDLYWARVTQMEIEKRRDSPKNLKSKHVQQQDESELQTLSQSTTVCSDSGDSRVTQFSREKDTNASNCYDNSSNASVYASSYASVSELGEGSATRKRWQASNPWTLKIDGPRALMEFIRAFIGYIL
jgi:hypothetical protein